MQAPIRLHADILIHGKSDVRVKRSVNDEQDGRGEAKTPVITFEERDSYLKNINSTFLSENGNNLILHDEQNGITPFMDIELIEAQDAGTRGLKVTANIDNDVAIIVHIHLTKKGLVRGFQMTSEGNSSLKKNVRALFGDESHKLGESESNKLMNGDKTDFLVELKIKMKRNFVRNNKLLQTRPVKGYEKEENTVLDIDLLLCRRGPETKLRRNRLMTISETKGPQLMNIQKHDSCMRLKDDKNRYKTVGILFQGLMGYPSIKCNEKFVRKVNIFLEKRYQSILKFSRIFWDYYNWRNEKSHFNQFMRRPRLRHLKKLVRMCQEINSDHRYTNHSFLEKLPWVLLSYI
ncbi:hypothetical protein QAD02_021905 [Eretmocerus hayati]|uniref:Uncharacterized protein n=1 Tax=Eretmocerus hayati TaxID=131215 RepID=A0ACC2PTJ7_9HYME|nr:hypothetical protein QAD02_021905 [Eretmocerus hayati]